MQLRSRGTGAFVAVLTAGLAIAAASPSTSPAVASTSDYKVATQTLPDGKNVVARWNPCQTITFRVNPNWVGPSTTARNAAIADVKTAFARASSATGIAFRYAGTTTEIPKDTSTKWYNRQTSAEIVVAWVNPSSSTAKTNLLGKSGSSYASGTGGYAFKYWKVGSDPWKGATGRGFVVINSLQNSKFRAGFGSGSTRGALLMHEIGHSLGMLHVGATSQLMYPTVLSRSSTGYASGDLAGLKRLGRTAGCITAPSWVWTNLS